MKRPFQQVDVFTATPYVGNPAAVVLEADGLSTEEMARVARWTNLSETTFVLPPTTDGADYRVRIFTPGTELPFAGHPTLGTCHAWLRAGGVQHHSEHTVQECAAGLIPIRRIDGHDRALSAAALAHMPAISTARANTASSIGSVRRPVNVFCWLGW